MTEQMEGQLNLFDQDSWSGKTCQEHSAVTEERTSEPSFAWRVLDAQYWGVPQRRRRIYLVADGGRIEANR